jgi:hypothetical protein
MQRKKLAPTMSLYLIEFMDTSAHARTILRSGLDSMQRKEAGFSNVDI